MNPTPKIEREISGPAARAARLRAFTLVELLAVIAIIGALAALLLAVSGNVSRVKKINTAKAELQQIETALENYKAKYGFYPPCNTNNYAVNQLYYELAGVTNNSGTYQTLDGNTSITTGNYTGQFSVGGIINCSSGGGDEVVYAKNFLPGIKPTQLASPTNGSGITFFFLVTSVGGPDTAYQPMLPTFNSSANPFRYVYPGVNNPGSYDLWVQLSINSTPASPHKYLVCNWSQQVQRNNPLP